MILRHGAIIGVLALVGLVVWGSSAGAHSFLVDTRPGQGERLSTPPAEVVFQFTEAVVADTVEVTVTGEGGEGVEAGDSELESEGRVYGCLSSNLNPWMGWWWCPGTWFRQWTDTNRAENGGQGYKSKP